MVVGGDEAGVILVFFNFFWPYLEFHLLIICCFLGLEHLPLSLLAENTRVSCVREVLDSFIYSFCWFETC